MKQFRIVLFGWEIQVCSPNYRKFHFTYFPETPEPEQRELDLSVEKRINALAKEHGLLDYVFRDLGRAVLTYHKDAVILVDHVMLSITEMRNNIKTSGAAEFQLKAIDERVCQNWGYMLDYIGSKSVDKNNPNQKKDLEMLEDIKSYDVTSFPDYKSGASATPAPHRGQSDLKDETA